MNDELLVYQQVHAKLLNRIKKNTFTERTIIFPVPTMVIGCKTYHMKKCIIFILKKMREQDFHILYKKPNLLLITLKKENFLPKKILPKQPDSTITCLDSTNETIANIISNVKKYTV